MDTLIWLPLLGAGCYVITLAIRRVVETALPHLQSKPYTTTFSRWWNQVILYLIPILVGLLGALALKGTSMVPPEMDSYRSCAIYGMVMGSMSSMLYKVMKMLVVSKAGVSMDTVKEVVEEKVE